jgi:predicted RecB family nuclease
MLRYEVAVGTPGGERDAARKWLLTYNRGDVEATHELREWMGRLDSRIEPMEVLT